MKRFEWTDSDGDRLVVQPEDTVSGSWWVTVIHRLGSPSVAVRLTAVEVDRLVRVLRPDWAPERVFEVEWMSGGKLAGAAWRVYRTSSDDSIAAFWENMHPDAEAAARAEADRLNELEVQS